MKVGQDAGHLPARSIILGLFAGYRVIAGKRQRNACLDAERQKSNGGISADFARKLAFEHGAAETRMFWPDDGRPFRLSPSHRQLPFCSIRRANRPVQLYSSPCAG